ncbi:glycoside hydrolase family 97 protein [Haliscomenobacter sp.]|uniref:glycoside hydrolase family 97 protein n=1 Tax=Haliscomenobacter sp. TaxID=2717303 RepID=UPI003BA85BA5
MKLKNLVALMLLSGIGQWAFAQGTSYSQSSPSGRIALHFQLSAQGEPNYRVDFWGKPIVAKSKLGFYLESGQLNQGFKLVQQNTRQFDETWQPVWGEVANIRNRYNELKVVLENATGQLEITFRVFDDGIGFRYGLLGKVGQSGELSVMEEVSEFAMTGDHTTWWQPGDWDSNEHTYTTSLISGIDGKKYLNETSISTQFIPDYRACQTPLAMRTATGVHLAIHEAALVNFPAMQLKVNNATRTFGAFLVPGKDLWRKASVPVGFQTPWRVVLISPDAPGLLASKLILNLNEPCKITDVSWIKPVKYVGIWWEMHLNKATWDFSGSQNGSSAQGTAGHGKHGATTANTRKYIDFASEHGFKGVLVEGWNIGWEDWFGKWKEDVFDFQTPYPDYDLPGLAKYSLEKGAPIIVHHETSGSATGYEKHIDKAFDLIQSLDLHAIKTGYVGRIIPKGEWHDGQWMINHYNRVLEKAAAKRIMVDAHEPVRPTGLHRTYPNFLASEATRGNEFNAWSKGNPPEHETILPFTRGLGGPIDYTPGIFNIKFSEYKASPNEYQVHTTLAKQLALYVTLYSPLQMAADLPEHYQKHLDAFQFIKDVAVDWDDTKILAAAIGDYIVTARKAKGSENWFLGAITDELPRNQSVKLSFLPAGKTYVAKIYEDAPDAHWKNNPTAYKIRSIEVSNQSVLALKLAAGGGAAVSLIPKE